MTKTRKPNKALATARKKVQSKMSEEERIFYGLFRVFILLKDLLREYETKIFRMAHKPKRKK